jgi:hypothetical protein
VSERPSEALRHAFATPDPHEPADRDCPDPGSIWDAVHARSTPPERRRIVEHLATCQACAADWRAAMVAIRASPAQFRRRWRPLPLAAAAVVLLGVALGVVLRSGAPETREPIFRALEAVSLGSPLADGASLPREAFVLRWDAVEEGTRYAVRVTDRRLEPLFEAGALTGASVEVPADALAGLEPDAVVLWQVEAVLPDGRRLVSETFTARLE